MQKDGTTGLTDRESPPEMHRTFLQYQGLTLQSYEQMFINRNKTGKFTACCDKTSSSSSLLEPAVRLLHRLLNSGLRLFSIYSQIRS